MKILDAYGDELIEGDPRELRATSVGIGKNAIRDAFEKAKYVEGSLPEGSNVLIEKPIKVECKVTLTVTVDKNQPIKTPLEYYAEATKARTVSKKSMFSIDDSKNVIGMPSPSEIGWEAPNSYDCITCGSKFDMTKEDEKWFIDKGWPIPKRCKSCRDKKKTEKLSSK